MSFTEGMSPADLAAVTGNNDGFGGGNGAWWIILLFLVLGWGRNGYGTDSNGGSSVKDQYVLSSDFATVQRQLSDGFNMLERKGDTINNGLCDGFYAQNTTLLNGFNGVNTGMLNGFNGINTSVMTVGNAIQGQISQCCCDTKSGIADLKYSNALNTKDIQQGISSGFCQTNFNNQSNTRDIIDSNNANTRAILDAINSNKVEALKDRIAEQNQQINALNLAASQSAQNTYLVNQLRPCPIPAYITCNPFGCNCGNGTCA